MRTKMIIIAVTLMCFSIINAQEQYGIGAFVGFTNRAVVSCNTSSQWQFGLQLGTVATDFDNLDLEHTALFVKRLLSEEKVVPYIGASVGVSALSNAVFVGSIPLGIQALATSNLAIAAEIAPTLFAHDQLLIVIGASIGVTYYLE